MLRKVLATTIPLRHHFLKKPSSFPLLKQAIQKVLAINWAEHAAQPSKDKFVLHV